VYDVQPKLKTLITFAPINLSDRLMLKRNEKSHIIFCRNVIIYFDDDMKRQVIESFLDKQLPGGCQFFGHAESLHNISRTFKPEHHVGTIVYRKQA
jgi:chemotaxis protein methyltransferase CheR